MVFYTPLDYDRQLALYSDKFNINLNGKKRGECANIIRNYCPRLHTEEELQKMAYNNLKAIEHEYGYKALRIFAYDVIKQDLLQSFTGKDRLQEKYEKLIDDVKKYHNKMRDEELELTLDVYEYYKILEEVYNEKYGMLKDWNHQLYCIMKTIQITNYKEDVIEALQNHLELVLTMCNGKYYLQQDLKNPKILKMLYQHIAEETFDEMEVMDYNICTEYDGYGNEYWIHEYSKSWTDDEGRHHYQSWEPQHTIEDYEKVGLPETEESD